MVAPARGDAIRTGSWNRLMFIVERKKAATETTFIKFRENYNKQIPKYSPR
jgi:hypothetical protein